VYGIARRLLIDREAPRSVGIDVLVAAPVQIDIRNRDRYPFSHSLRSAMGRAL
jgi:hypothetical protein